MIIDISSLGDKIYIVTKTRILMYRQSIKKGALALVDETGTFMSEDLGVSCRIVVYDTWHFFCG